MNHVLGFFIPFFFKKSLKELALDLLIVKYALGQADFLHPLSKLDED